ncbi:uncharacterized protein LOC127135869 [Lathyrus oleraceus]|uniref:uncharacterized protein LOC127113364 n=1 Tax=Pisum sativum TaxID=3888 RepID=UPI0021D03DC3|nr:uncharacterized protein LOC127113364 [Pisum sativum]XP_050918455.1 uncharacterized protein LOC127135869 [Pisum sativum]
MSLRDNDHILVVFACLRVESDAEASNIGGIAVDLSKVDIVLQLEAPKSVTEIRSFLRLVCKVTIDIVRLGTLKQTNGFLYEIKDGQKLDVSLIDPLSLVNQSEDEDFKVDENGILKFRNRVCVPGVSELKKTILEESHKSNLSIYPEATKMYQDLNKTFWCPGIKRDVVEFVYACLTFQKS